MPMEKNRGSIEARNERLANALGTTVEELEKIPHEITGDCNADGILLGYVVQFSSTAPVHFLKKIKGLTSANSAYIPASVIDVDESNS